MQMFLSPDPEFLLFRLLSKRTNNYNMTIKSIPLPDLCGYDILCLTKEESSLRFFKNGMLRKTDGPNTITRYTRKLHAEEIQDFVSPDNVGMIKSRILKWAGHVTRVREKNSYRILVSTADREIGHLYNLRLYVSFYKSEGRWFYPSWFQWIFHWHKILPIVLWSWGRLSL